MLSPNSLLLQAKTKAPQWGGGGGGGDTGRWGGAGKTCQEVRDRSARLRNLSFQRRVCTKNAANFPSFLFGTFGYCVLFRVFPTVVHMGT